MQLVENAETLCSSGNWTFETFCALPNAFATATTTNTTLRIILRHVLWKFYTVVLAPFFERDVI